MQEGVTIRVNTMCEHETPLKGDFAQLRTTRMPRRHLRQYFPANVISCSARFQYSFPCIFGRKSAYLLVWLHRTNPFVGRSDLSLSTRWMQKLLEKRLKTRWQTWESRRHLRIWNSAARMQP